MSAASHSATNSPSLREAQRAFFGEMLRGENHPLGVLEDEHGLDSSARFSVYQTAYSIRLTAVLRSDHPTLARCLPEQFERLAVAYARTHPSRVRSLRDFGDGFPDFLGDALEVDGAPARALAQFERTLLEVFDAASAS